MKWMKGGGLLTLGIGLFLITAVVATTQQQASAKTFGAQQAITVPMGTDTGQATLKDPGAVSTPIITEVATPTASDLADETVAAFAAENAMVWEANTEPTTSPANTMTAKIADTDAASEDTVPAGTKVGTDNTAHNQQAAKKQATDGSPTPNPLL